MDRLVSVDTKEILLHYTLPSSHPQRRRRRRSAGFRVTNLMHTMSVAVHLSTSRPSSSCFSFSPPSALDLLPPLSSSSFSLHYLPGADDAPDGGSASPLFASPLDAVVVRTTMVPTGKADTALLLSLFSGPASPQVFVDARIPIYFVGPDAVLRLSSLSSSSPATAAPLTLDTTFLLSKAASACSPSELSSFLLRATTAGNPHYVAAILDAGADPNNRDAAGKSVLFFAIAAGSLETVHVLLDAGAIVDPTLDRLIMHEAAATNSPVDLMRAVANSIAASWWAYSTDYAGQTPLHVAAAHGHLEAARFCLSPPSSSSSSGCDPDRADAKGWTPLHHAAAGGYLEVARLLLGCCSYATKYALTADSRKTAFDLAVDAAGAHDDSRPLLAFLRLDELLHRAAALGDAGGVRSCLARGAAVDCRDQNGWTPLHRAAFKGRAEVAEILIEHGAEVDAADSSRWTPLRCAAESSREEVVILLVEHGAKLAAAGLKGLASAEALLAGSDTFPGPGKKPDPMVGRFVPSDISIPVLDWTRD